MLALTYVWYFNYIFPKFVFRLDSQEQVDFWICFFFYQMHNFHNAKKSSYTKRLVYTKPESVYLAIPLWCGISS